MVSWDCDCNQILIQWMLTVMSELLNKPNKIFQFSAPPQRDRWLPQNKIKHPELMRGPGCQGVNYKIIIVSFNPSSGITLSKH